MNTIIIYNEQKNLESVYDILRMSHTRRNSLRNFKLTSQFIVDIKIQRRKTKLSFNNEFNKKGRSKHSQIFSNHPVSCVA